MTELHTRYLTSQTADIATAANILADGGLVGFATETVYGLGADARNSTAVARIYEAKGRPSFNPLIVHVPDLDAARCYVEFNDLAERLASAFWPGAMTLVLPIKQDAGISPLVTAGLDTLAIRVPDAPIAQQLLREFGGPVAAPSANPSGQISPTTAQHVMNGLSGRIEAVLDAGPCGVGVESTIIGCSDVPRLLRAGGIPVEAIEAALGQPLQGAKEGITAPGQMTSHYAPNGTMRLNVTDPDADETVLGFGNVDCTINLSPSGDLVQAAARLFDCLHQLNDMGAQKIAVTPVPITGLGRAINDRLTRAAAPRD
ncbi:threonylcarbamoyl-AMP synthase [Marivivens niveibacter]|uniref:Threonylcarbamoyl-AMP synthase n=1 Tax=Marivivens niveibacter TaxID=1930667 RepID=A0A251X0B8_9RHOB|nr:L-threonylcarbamoyladenylate synthase [Marivivens niveibacter]OUD10072.1 threonylcarbamoyl-AMP synthase [Marivivens niveibacter]